MNSLLTVLHNVVHHFKVVPERRHAQTAYQYVSNMVGIQLFNGKLLTACFYQNNKVVYKRCDICIIAWVLIIFNSKQPHPKLIIN